MTASFETRDRLIVLNSSIQDVSTMTSVKMWTAGYT